MDSHHDQSTLDTVALQLCANQAMVAKTTAATAALAVPQSSLKHSAPQWLEPLLPCAFDAGRLDTFRRIARPPKLMQVAPSPLCLLIQNTPTASGAQMGPPSASDGPKNPCAPSPLAPTTMPAPFAPAPHMEHMVAQHPAGDPHWVATLLNAVAFEQTLSRLNLLQDWRDVIAGIKSSFSVGINATLSRTYLFRQSCIHTHQSCLH
ncbi:hypothetical protein BDQ17DRAFT_1437961 [Cyathus striatus]|nr:hypothetical protein BDQ17DRAFT_1437961 [Cyathus striatus]